MEMKADSEAYQQAKSVLTGEGGPFAGWIPSGPELQKFNSDGQIGVSTEQGPPCNE